MRLALLALLIALAASSAEGASTFAGEWATQGHSARVRIAPCFEDPKALCGTVTWLWEPLDGRGAPVRDSKNPDERLRARPLIGLTVLESLREKKTAGLATGSTYNPENGRTYAVQMRLRSDDVLEVKGCVLFLCETQVWRRIESVCHQPMHETSAAGVDLR